MNDQIQNVVAKIFAIEDTGMQIKLKDENKRSLGGFFKTKKDGGQTVAYTQFQDMGIESGSVVEIGFKEVPYKDGTIKNIISFRESAGRPVPHQSVQNAPEHEFVPDPEELYATVKTPPTQDAFGRRLALHGFANARLQNHTIQQVKLELQDLLALEDYINEIL